MTAMSGARWIGLSQVVRIVAQVVSMAVLARLIPPAEYGVMAMATVVTNFALIFRDLGSSSALIQAKTLDDRTKTAVFWFNVGLGLVTACLAVLLAPVIAAGFDAPKLVSVLLVLALVFPLSSAGAVPQALLERSQAFRIVARIEILSTTGGLVLAVLMAWWGAGVYSLVGQALLAAGLSTLQLWKASGWRPERPRRSDGALIKKILGFSGNLVGFNLVNYAARNGDVILVGRFFSAATLGAYSLAYRVMLFPLQSLTFVATRALYPVLSRQQDNLPAMRETHLQMVTVVAALVAPMMAGMGVLRQDFVLLFVGPEWGLSAELLAWLAPTGFLQSIASTTSVIFMALGRTRALLYLGLFNALTQLVAFAIGVQFGIHAMVGLYFVANAVNFLVNLHLCRRQMEGRLADILLPVLAPVLASSVMMVAITVASAWLKGRGVNILPAFACMVLAGAVVYFVILRLISKRSFSAVLALFPTRRGRPRAL